MTKSWLISAGIAGISIAGHATPVRETRNIADKNPKRVSELIAKSYTGNVTF